MSHKLTIQPYLIKFIPTTPTVTEDITIYGFDLDHTLIKPKAPNAIHSRSSDDWVFMEFNDGIVTIDRLIEIAKEDTTSQIVVFTNQGGVVASPPTSKSCVKFTDKIKLILKYISDLPEGQILLGRLWIYGSPKKPASLFPTKKGQKKTQSTLGSVNKLKKASVHNKLGDAVLTPEIFENMRKPRLGMFQEFKRDLTSECTDLKIKWKYYCGDAAGRKSDFSDSDKQFAANLQVDFRLPEEVFKK
ncbi:hypothetical protein TPHA_0G01930 [Tetrapisispora phaffii CBS 4417]|uniref:DNA 3'-phosphatase n=1 Tax=Tetrapisispora phaffii (strain ATCC 24235 / CBS 4417 / NBRC 1672 / NRRL Y-8282 / UCD 70-5) TaxID=1071381 RepID=G8BVV1_TETPH|nr:hypothetical protein TPHA_0G01930 [Tetrapisispora phaffii CBS 4417]CCE64029.1 hypothetical protein TPHA_0G01930 [Tetrapisispora phaffii CBS 4417]